MSLVITTCTNRKRRPVADRLHMGALWPSPLTDLAANWCSRLLEGERADVRGLYAGRAFQVAANAADKLDARLLVVSAGLGLIDARSSVPPYACTVLTGVADSVASRATDGVTPGRWWRILQSASPFALNLGEIVAESKGPILAALSDTYLEMFADDLLAIDPSALMRLRLFTRTPLARVPQGLRPFVMPYDDRLDGLSSSQRGPRSYFAARALAHFAGAILIEGDVRPPAEHRRAVSVALQTWAWPVKVERRRLSDAEVMVLMETHWEETGGSAGRLLRLLRDELGVACEQGRCKLLAQQVREGRA